VYPLRSKRENGSHIVREEKVYRSNGSKKINAPPAQRAAFSPRHVAPTIHEHGAPLRGDGGATYSDTALARRNEGWGRSPEEGAGAAMVRLNFAAPALSFGFLWFFLGKERTRNQSILLIETAQSHLTSFFDPSLEKERT